MRFSDAIIWVWSGTLYTFLAESKQVEASVWWADQERNVNNRICSSHLKARIKANGPRIFPWNEQNVWVVNCNVYLSLDSNCNATFSLHIDCKRNKLIKIVAIGYFLKVYAICSPEKRKRKSPAAAWTDTDNFEDALANSDAEEDSADFHNTLRNGTFMKQLYLEHFLHLEQAIKDKEL